MNQGVTAPTTTVREAVGVFHEWTALQNAVDDLLAHGFDRSELSLLADEKVCAEALGSDYQKVSDLEDDAKAPRIAFAGRDSLVEAKTFAVTGLGYVGAMVAVGGIVATGGTLAAAIAAAAAAGGGGVLIGSWLARHIGRGRAASVEKQLDKGGLLLWVRTRDPVHERRALETLTRHGATDVHAHDLVTEAVPEGDPLADRLPDPFLPGART